MPTIPIAHDFTCAWCWIGLSQARRLRREFGVEIEWRAYEGYPGGYPARERPAEERPSRLALAFAAEGLEPPVVEVPRGVVTFAAHTAVELAEAAGVADLLVERIYRAYWLHGLDIGSPDVLAFLCKGLPIEEGELRAAIADRRFEDRIVPFDEPAWATGVRYLPTFFVGDRALAEEPYAVIREAVRGWLSTPLPPSSREAKGGGVLSTPLPPSSRGAKGGGEGGGPYDSLVFGVAPADRPYVAINMVTTIDGKSISGERDEAVMDLGSAADHDALRQIEHAAQAVLIGAGTLRATPKIRYPDHLLRFVVSRSGAVDPASGFFTARPDRAFLVVPRGVAPPLAEERVLRIGEGEVDFRELVRRMRVDYGIETLVVEGGSETNARLLAADLVDELFLTLAPKIKLGRDLPTYAGGDPLPRHGLLGFRLIEHHVVADEVFLRYRRARDSDEGGSEHV